MPKEYNEIWISLRIQYGSNTKDYIARDLEIEAGGGNDDPIRLYADSYYFDQNNRVAWAIQYDPFTRTISVPDNWIIGYSFGTKFTPGKIITILGRKFK